MVTIFWAARVGEPADSKSSAPPQTTKRELGTRAGGRVEPASSAACRAGKGAVGGLCASVADVADAGGGAAPGEVDEWSTELGSELFDGDGPVGEAAVEVRLRWLAG